MSKQEMELDVWGADWGLPSVDFKCLQVMAVIKFLGAQVKINKTNNPFKTPNGYLPVFKHQKEKLTSFENILSCLKTKTFAPDVEFWLPDSVPKQSAESVAYENMLNEKLLPAIHYIWWVDNRNYLEVTRPWYAKAMPFPLNYYYPGHYQRHYTLSIQSLYSYLEEGDIETEIYKEAEKCLTCISNRLGDLDYFYGKHPSTIDALIYGYLAVLLKTPFPSNVLQNHLKASSNLVRYVVRITQRYFTQESKDYDNIRQKETEKNPSKAEISFPNKRRKQIFACLFALIAMFSYGFTMGIFSINVNSNTQPIESDFHLHDEEDEQE